VGGGERLRGRHILIPAIELDGAKVYRGDCREVLRGLADNSVDSIVTDPPYELGFMGKKWDSSGIAYDVDVWQQCLRVLKPGGHILAFGGSRTFHRLAVAIEDAGYEIRDTIAWISSKTFPKSLNVAKAIAKQGKDGSKAEGWGTGLKQVVEPVVLARKPLEGTVADNFLRWGVGGLNIDASRIGHEEVTINTFDNGAKPFGNAVGEAYTSRVSTGRWPANVLLDEEAAQTVDKQSGASRFFYVATASKKDRNEGLNTRNTHPTVKPVALMQYLIRLITPPGGLVLDPFTGSGSTGKAALLYGYGFIGAELTDEYLPIIEGRLKWALDNKDEGLF
jgi:DNA modification methylase